MQAPEKLLGEEPRTVPVGPDVYQHQQAVAAEKAVELIVFRNDAEAGRGWLARELDS